MMSWYLVTWIAWACPGDILSKVTGGLPPKVRPLICEERVESEAFSRRDIAERKVDELGAEARPRLWAYVGLRRKELPVTFNPRR